MMPRSLDSLTDKALRHRAAMALQALSTAPTSTRRIAATNACLAVADELDTRRTVDMSDLDPGLVENDHLDNGHPTFVDGCPLCDDAEAPTLVVPAEKAKVEPTGRKNIDHSACPHPPTKAARAKCRKAIAQTMAEIKSLSNIHDHE
jgi:hypothetical protein